MAEYANTTGVMGLNWGSGSTNAIQSNDDWVLNQMRRNNIPNPYVPLPPGVTPQTPRPSKKLLLLEDV